MVQFNLVLSITFVKLAQKSASTGHWIQWMQKAKKPTSLRIEDVFTEFNSPRDNLFSFFGGRRETIEYFLPQYRTDSWFVKLKTIWNLSKVPHTNFVPNFVGGSWPDKRRNWYQFWITLRSLWCNWQNIFLFCFELKRNKSLERSFSFSDTESAPEVRRLRGPWGSASETDLARKALVGELHQRFSSAESLARAGGTRRYRHHQRAASIMGLSRGEPDWRSTSVEELRAKKSSKSIEVGLHKYYCSVKFSRHCSMLYNFIASNFEQEKFEKICSNRKVKIL